MELKGKQKALLRKLANQKEIMFQVGLAGVTDNVIKNIKENLLKHEVGRISVLKNCPDSIEDVVEKLTNAGIYVVYRIGRVVLMYQENKNKAGRIKL